MYLCEPEKLREHVTFGLRLHHDSISFRNRRNEPVSSVAMQRIRKRGWKGWVVETKKALPITTQGTDSSKEQEEQDVLYVLLDGEGHVRAELMMTPSMAAEINARRRQRGARTGDWEQQPLKHRPHLQ